MQIQQKRPGNNANNVNGAHGNKDSSWYTNLQFKRRKRNLKMDIHKHDITISLASRLQREALSIFCPGMEKGIEKLIVKSDHINWKLDLNQVQKSSLYVSVIQYSSLSCQFLADEVIYCIQLGSHLILCFKKKPSKSLEKGKKERERERVELCTRNRCIMLVVNNLIPANQKQLYNWFWYQFVVSYTEVAYVMLIVAVKTESKASD